MIGSGTGRFHLWLMKGLALIAFAPFWAHHPFVQAQEDVALEVGLADRTDLSVTFYQQDLAQIRDRRSVILPAGEGLLLWPGLTAMVEPRSLFLHHHGKPDDFRMLEQGYDARTLTRESLLQAYLGQSVHIYRTDPKTGEDRIEKARVLSVADGVLLDIAGRIESLDQMPGRLVFPQLPKDAQLQPHYSAKFSAPKKGPQDLTLNYLTGGFRWSADYVAILDDDDPLMAMEGRISLENSSGADLDEAAITVIAGEVNRKEAMQPIRPMTLNRMMAADAAVMLAPDAMADRYLYRLPHKISLADGESKQVGFVDLPQIKVLKSYLYRANDLTSLDRPVSADLELSFTNDDDAGAGVPLPAGVVRFYEDDEKAGLLFVGEDQIAVTPKGGRPSLSLGKAFDVTIKPLRRSYEIIENSAARQVTEVGQSYHLRNQKKTAVDVTIEQAMPAQSWEVIKQSHEQIEATAQQARWRIAVPAGGDVTLDFTVQLIQPGRVR